MDIEFNKYIKQLEEKAITIDEFYSECEEVINNTEPFTAKSIQPILDSGRMNDKIAGQRSRKALIKTSYRHATSVNSCIMEIPLRTTCSFLSFVPRPSMQSERPSSSINANCDGLSLSQRKLSLGCAWGSTTVTRAPRRANTSAAMLPARPAPTISTSDTTARDDDTVTCDGAQVTSHTFEGVASVKTIGFCPTTQPARISPTQAGHQATVIVYRWQAYAWPVNQRLIGSADLVAIPALKSPSRTQRQIVALAYRQQHCGRCFSEPASACFERIR